MALKTVVLGRDDAADLFDRLRDVYAEVYAEPTYNRTEEDVAEFRERFHRQVAQPGFAFVAADHDGQVAGFTYGVSFEAGKWWRGAVDEPPQEVKDAATFAVIELVLRKPYRGQGLGRRMMDALLKGRTEPYATLLASPDAPARQMYRHWGWRQVGTVRSYSHWDPNDALVLPLPKGGRLPEVARVIKEAVDEYEAGETREAVVARDADKLECLVQAVEYRSPGVGTVQPWIDSCRAALKTPSAVRLADSAEAGDVLGWRSTAVAGD